MDPTLEQAVDTAKHHPWIFGVLPHVLTVIGFLLAVFAIARLVSERKQPGNTFAWLLAIVLLPYVGVPLFLIFGGRKLRRLAATKARLCPVVPGAPPSTAADNFAARVLMLNGACPPVGGNQVRFVASGEAAFHNLEEQILAAKHSIHIMTFILGRDAVGRRLVKLLAQRAREGVKVRLLLDSLGCFLTKGSFCDPIRQAGGEVVSFMPMLPLSTRGSANLRNHRKIAVFDHRLALLGGRNMAADYMGPTPLKRRFRDFGSVIEGPAVSLLEEIFLADWAYASGQSIAQLHEQLPANPPVIAGSSELQIVASGPDVQGDPLYEGILSLVQQAERSVWIVTPYYIPDEVLQRSLMVQARAGVDVRLAVPAKSNHRITDIARRHYLRELQQAGGKVLLYGPGMNHAKAILVDESIALWGSANMDLRSLFVNFEVAAVSYSQPDAAALGEWMQQDVFAHSHTKPPPRTPPRFFTTLSEELSRLLAPML